MYDFHLWQLFVSLGIPGLALGVLFMLFRRFHWEFSKVPRRWVGPICVLFLVLSSIIVFTVLLLWAPQRAGVTLDTDSSVDPLILSMRIKHFTGPEAKYLGDIGVTSHSIHLNDDIRVHATFGRPLYSFLVALNADGSEQLCYPGTRSTRPQQVAHLDYPEDPTKYFGLTDGIGLQVFVLAASEAPLTSFDEWRSHLSGVKWDVAHTTGSWQFDGLRFKPVPMRGVERSRAEPPLRFVRICEAIGKAPGIVAVRAIAFPVSRSEAEVDPILLSDSPHGDSHPP